MKRIFITFVLAVVFLQFSTAQQIYNTNTKSTCTYQGTADLQGCSDVTLNCVFTFNENQKTFVHDVNGTVTTYNIVSKTYESPYWNYRISTVDGVSYNLWVNQREKQFFFSPVTLTNGNTVYKYTFN